MVATLGEWSTLTCGHASFSVLRSSMRKSRKARIDLDAELLGRVARVLVEVNAKRAARDLAPMTVLQWTRRALMNATKRGARKPDPMGLTKEGKRE
jgi:Arc/MetJ family transcription regulator